MVTFRSCRSYICHSWDAVTVECCKSMMMLLVIGNENVACLVGNNVLM